MKIKWKNVLKLVVSTIVIAYGILMVASYIDINKHNEPYETGYQHFASWNIFA